MPDRARFILERPGIRIARAAPTPRHVLRIRRPSAEVLSKLGTALGLEWPVQPNTFAGTGPTAFWLAPGEWLISGPLEGQQKSALASACHGVTYHLSEIGDGQATVALEGALCRDLLATGCGLDLHPRSFAENRCAQTLLAQVPVLLYRSGRDGFGVVADTSLAPYLCAWFTDAFGVVSAQDGM